MASCVLLNSSMLRIHTREDEDTLDIPITTIIRKSPRHVLLTNHQDLIQAELLFGLNEILIQYQHNGYQCPMNEEVKSYFDSF
jgi:hypothetical protein